MEACSSTAPASERRTRRHIRLIICSSSVLIMSLSNNVPHVLDAGCELVFVILNAAMLGVSVHPLRTFETFLDVSVICDARKLEAMLILHPCS